MPALSTANVGTTYDFLVTTAVGAGTTVTFVYQDQLVSNFFATLQLTGGVAANLPIDNAGDTLTLG